MDRPPDLSERTALSDPGTTREPSARLLGASLVLAAGMLAAIAVAAADSATLLALTAVAATWCIATAALLVRHLRKLYRTLSVDQLTGLHNRQHFETQLAAALAQCSRLDTECAVMMIDIDRFKEINDTYGHQAGDELLLQVGERLADSIRQYDTAARYGGEEFAIVMPHTDEHAALVVAERLRKAAADRPFRLKGGLEVAITLSIGYSVFPDDALGADELVRRADLALYTCKRYGRNQLRRCTDTDMSAVDVQRHRELIEALAAVVDLRDWGTGEHARDVSLWSKQLAEALQLDPVTVSTVEAAAIVHDIGKVGVPDGILRKPGPLDGAEWTLIQEHPGWGAEIVGRVSNMERVSKMVEQHQEWTDGGGYPFGLRHEEIDIGARIIAVVDAYHAMVTDRPYRDARTDEQAVAELRQMAGSQFDETCVRVFCELIERGLVQHRPDSADRSQPPSAHEHPAPPAQAGEAEDAAA